MTPDGLMSVITKQLRAWYPLLPALVVFVALAYHFNFYQDDAYISYRYVANYLNGHGLVYNIGERVEGFTNFGWVIYLLFWGVLGVNYLIVSKLTGLVLGAGAIAVTYLIGRELFGENNRWFAVAAAYLVGCNQSLAYWSPAGLETAAFVSCVILSLYFYLRRSWMLIAALSYAVLLRPEGALVAGLLIVIEAVQSRAIPRFALLSAAVAFVVSMPFVAFKLWYYGSLFPNPFYAKTSFTLTQLANGWEYTWRFLRHYGFYGIPLAAPLLLRRGLSVKAQTVWLFGLLYTLYIILVGGDVLKVHRFFLPIVGVVAILIVLVVYRLTVRIQHRTRLMVLLLAMLPLLALTYYLPHHFVTNYNIQERAFVKKMRFRADVLKTADSSDFSVATSTIGIFGYELIGHDVIDLLGLTDSTIARYSEEPIPGMKTTWKEAKHNSKYLLSRAPDYILFSTGVKPSALAEKALLLYPQFLHSYRSIAWYFHNREFSPKGVLTTAFKKVRPLTGEIKPTYPVAWVENYKLGLDAAVHNDFGTALRYFQTAIQVSPKPYYPNLMYMKGYSLLNLQQDSKAKALYEEVLAQDSMVYEAHKDLYIMARLARDSAASELHHRWLKKLVPWYLPRLDSLAQQSLARQRRYR